MTPHKKKRTFKDIPTRRFKDVSGICSPISANIWNEEILLNKDFPENLKLADVPPIFKNKDKTFVEITDQNLLYLILTIFERIISEKKLSLHFYVDIENDSMQNILY